MKNCGHDAIKKLALLDFVMAAQASYIYFGLLRHNFSTKEKSFCMETFSFINQGGGVGET